MGVKSPFRAGDSGQPWSRAGVRRRLCGEATGVQIGLDGEVSVEAQAGLDGEVSGATCLDAEIDGEAGALRRKLKTSPTPWLPSTKSGSGEPARDAGGVRNTRASKPGETGRDAGRDAGRGGPPGAAV